MHDGWIKKKGEKMNVMAEYENMFVVQEQLSITMLNKIMNK